MIGISPLAGCGPGLPELPQAVNVTSKSATTKPRTARTMPPNLSHTQSTNQMVGAALDLDDHAVVREAEQHLLRRVQGNDGLTLSGLDSARGGDARAGREQPRRLVGADAHQDEHADTLAVGKQVDRLEIVEFVRGRQRNLIPR